MKPLSITIKKWLQAAVLAVCCPLLSFAQVSNFEYFFDRDPGFGNGTAITSGFTPGTTVDLNQSIPVTGLNGGFHALHIRAKTGTGLWGHTYSRFFYITTIGGPSLSEAEYFFDTDPGTGNGHSIAINTGATVAQTVSIPVTGLPAGFHQLYLRVKNTNGNWGHYQTRAFLVTNMGNANADITAIEYFFDTDPGNGRGHSISVSQSADVNEVIAIPVNGLATGFHQLYLRARNNMNIWGHYQTRSFVVTQINNSNRKIAGAEYFVDTDPGNGNGTAIAINPPADSINQTMTLSIPSGLAEGNHQLYIRTKNEQGQWSLFQTSTFIVKPPRPGSGFALQLDGNDDAIALGTHFNYQTFSVEMWLKPGATQSHNTNIIDNNHTGGRSWRIQQVGANTNQYDLGGGFPTLAPFTLKADEWQHVVITASPTQKAVYVNGRLVSSDGAATIAYDGTESLHLGRWAGGGYNWNGQMDEVRIWNTALTETEIRDRMCRKITSADALYNNLLSYYNFDEKTGDILADDIGGHAGTLMNGPAWVHSGAPIGNYSAHSYAGATATANLVNPGRGDALTATLTGGSADGLQIYCVTDTPNSVAGATCLGSNNGYFGVFAVNGSVPAYEAVYNYNGIFLNALHEAQVKLFARADNSTGNWTDAGAVTDTAIHTATTQQAQRGEYIVSNAVVAPTITITAAPGIVLCAGTPATFTASITNGGTAPVYQWKKNGNPVGTDSISYTDLTLQHNDIITCELTSNSTCVSPATATSNAITMTITTGLTAAVTITAVPGNTICAGTQVTYTAHPVNGGTMPAYQWYINDIAAGGNAATYTSSTFSNSDKIACSMATNASCATPATVTSVADTLHVNPVLAPSITVAANTSDTICAGTRVTFTASVTHEGPAPVYQWKKNNNLVGTNSSTYSDSLLQHNDQITCTLLSNALCANPATTSSAAKIMSVRSTAAPAITVYSNTGTTICSGAPVTFTATIANGGDLPSYQWMKNNAATGTNSYQYTDNNLSDGDVITCQLTSSNTCAMPLTAISNASTMTVNAYQLPAISISSNRGNVICQGTEVTFMAHITNGGTSPTYQWKKNNIPVGNNSFTYSSSNLQDNDTISCTLSSNFACATQPSVHSNELTMTIHALPVINAGADQVILQGSSVVLTASGGTNYLWNTGDTTATIIKTPNATTAYTVSSTNAADCTQTDTVTVTVNYSALSLSTGSYNFGNTVINTTAGTSITITNTGTLTDTVSSVTVNGPFSTTFTSQIITPGNAVTIPVSFTPAGTLIYQQLATITTSAGNFVVTLQGRGVNAAPAWTVTPSTYNYTPTQLGDSSFHSFVISNTGNVPLRISGLTSDDPAFYGSAASDSIPVAGQANLIVRFKPTAIQNYTAGLTLTAANAGLSSLLLNLSGSGYVVGTPPSLQYVIAAPYNGNSGIDKPVGIAGDFTYRIVYKHPNNIAPQQGYPKVGIDLNADGDFIDAGEGLFSMSATGNGGNWQAGEVFSYTTNLPNGNTYGYRFYARDSLGNTATTAPANYVSGPHVTNQALDLSIYANDITFSNSNPAVGQQFTVSAVLHNGSPYSANNVPVSFYKDSIYLTSMVVPFMAANTTVTVTQVLSFPVDGFYPIKVWIDTPNSLGENNPLNNFAIRPVIVGNFTLPGTILVTSNAVTHSCPATAASISGYATYSGLNLAGTPPVLGATVTVQIAGGPTLTTHTVTGGYWSVYYTGFTCGQVQNYTVTVTDYTLTSSATPGIFNAPCSSCNTPTYYYVQQSGAVAGGCIREQTPFTYNISLVNDCNNDTVRNDTTYVYANGVLAYTHVQPVLHPCQQVPINDVFTLAAGEHILSFRNVYYDSTGRHEYSQSNSVTVQPDLPDLMLGSFTQTGSTAFRVNDINGTCINAGAHRVYLYDSVANGARTLIDSFSVTSIAAQQYQTLNFNQPGWQMGYHYLKLVTDVHDAVAERNETNNELEALLYVPFPELTVSNVTISNSNIGSGSVVNYSAVVHNSGSVAGPFHVQFLANGLPIGNKVPVSGLAGSGTTTTVVSDAYTVSADSCPVRITAIVDINQSIAELIETNNADSMQLAIDLLSGVGCNGLGSSCNPYVVVKNAVNHFTSAVRNNGTRDAGAVSVQFTVNGQQVGSDQIPGIQAQAGAGTGLYHSFSAAGNYVIRLLADSANTICESDETNNIGSIYVSVVEGMPDLEILSQHISPTNLNPNPGQSISVVASVFNKGNQTAAPTKIRLWVDNVQLGVDIQIDSLLPGRDTSVLATATYSSATVGPKIIRVKADALDELTEIRENNNEATRAIIVGGAPDLSHSLHEAITLSSASFRKHDTIMIRNYLRNYGGDQGSAWLRFSVNDSLGARVFTDSVQFTLLSNDSMIVSKAWAVNMVGRGLITTDIVRSNPQEFNELNNTDTFSFAAGPALQPLLTSVQPVICEGQQLDIQSAVTSDGQAVTYEWYHNQASTGVTHSGPFSISNVTLAASGNYTLKATDYFGTVTSNQQAIIVNPVLVPAVSIHTYPGTIICKGTSVKFTAQPVNGGALPVYEWRKNGVVTGLSDGIYRDSTLNDGDVISCTMVSNAPCTATLPVSAASISMTVNALAGTLASGNASQTYDVDSSMRFNYTDNNCRLIASVTSLPGSDLGPTTATTSINPSLSGFVQRFTEITPTYNLPAYVKLYFLPAEFAAYNVTAQANGLPLLPVSHNDPAISNIVIYQYHGLPSSGSTGPGGMYDASNVTLIPTTAIAKVWNDISGYWEISFPVTGFSGHFLKAENNSPLPIVLDELQAVNEGSYNKITWNTHKEEQGDYFELERSSDGSTFNKITTIKANGSASIYHHTDESPVYGINYYRLRMYNSSGRSHISKVVSARVNSAAFSINVFPNPASDQITIVTTPATGKGSIQITDVSGAVVQTEVTNGLQTVVNISKLPAGVYFVKYKDERNVQSIRLVKQ
jgi:hypothetical protein